MPNITQETLRKRAEFVRTGGRGSIRRTVKAAHRNTGDEKKVQSVLKRLGVTPFNEIDEAIFYRQDGSVYYFDKPKVQASMQSHCFVVSGPYDVKEASEIAQ
ncbi:putative transcription factor btf3 [Trypanosoma cruzi]|nr:basic transcription factor 3a, putative [Trypanosoma cruzi]ESS64372.1 basic transcription factor 3a [Trypanosoma cruzi Dm28c]PBJ69423.1 basic transcription factor 3a [Trypanosoma cruzi cruzi]EAN85389.1 basic transcription factor 3a, putative [Trypanosoma cruzi]KAF8281923.1 putative transcription factor BTF3 [Trypanosoma cruzi]KAF8286636.1 putative transcription factor BTF3 [Trypanosoma cruzi]|eukprot:XP_807240.1 basic transcription factor 3a [Trypanosoma cruzi strain CL Brener]